MTVYFANPTGQARDAMLAGLLGYIDTPMQGNSRPAGVQWIADNGCFGKGFDEGHWWRWLTKHADHASDCLFATAPDVVGDAVATLGRSSAWLPKIRAIGYPAALVAQDGLESLPVPWDEFDALFHRRHHRMETRTPRPKARSGGEAARQMGSHGASQLAETLPVRRSDRMRQRGRHLPHVRAVHQPAETPRLARRPQRTTGSQNGVHMIHDLALKCANAAAALILAVGWRVALAAADLMNGTTPR